MKTVLAGSWHTGGMNAIKPVFERLIKEGKVHVVVLGHEISVQILEKAGLEFKTIKDFGLADVSVESMENLLMAVRPDLVLTGTSSQDQNVKDVLEQNLVLAGRRMGIKTLAVLDFWAGYVQRFTDQRTGQLLDRLPDCIAIMDEVAKEEMLALDFPPKKMEVTGNPHFDDLAQRAKDFSEQDRQSIRKKIGFPSGTLYFFAGNTFESEKAQYGYWDLDIINLIVQILPDLPGVNVAVRLHPRMPEQDLQKISQAIAPFADRIKLVKNVDSQTLALTANVTIVEFSTMGIEAVYMGRPCISLQPNLIGDDQLVISRKDVIPVGYSQSACRSLLLAASEVQYRGALLKQSENFATDGKATERVVVLVHEMLI